MKIKTEEMKKEYIVPSCKVFYINMEHNILSGSGEPEVASDFDADPDVPSL